MQTSVPELMDIAKEPKHDPRDVRHAAGREVASPTTACWPAGWSRAASASSSSTTGAGISTAIDQSNDIRYGLVNRCRETDQPIAALIKDLKQRGLLRRDADRLGRRVRPHADERGTQRLEVAGPRPQPARLHDLDGRRRRQAGHQPTARPTTSAITPSRTGARPRPAGHDPAPAWASTTRG